MILSRFLPLLSAAGVSAFTTTPLTTLVPPLDNRPSLSTSRQPDQASSSMLLLMKVLKDGDDADDKLGRDIISTTTTNGFVDHPLSADADLPTNHRTAAGGGVALVTVLSGLIPTVANAAGPDWGLFEGKTGSLLHPVMMGGLFLYTLYTAFLGFQWRRQRTMGTEITALQKQLPSGYNTVSSIQAALSGKGDAADAGEAYSTEQWKSYLAIAEQVEELQKERKDLAAAGPRDRHFSQGALLAFLGTAFAIEGPLNTYARAGKLFPGPHLYVGAGLVVIWALAVATIPSMQKGNETARSIHIGANILGLGFFAWQVQSGLPILFKVWEKTSWP